MSDVEDIVSFDTSLWLQADCAAASYRQREARQNAEPPIGAKKEVAL